MKYLNEYVVHGDIAYIILNQSFGIFKCIIDIDDIEKCKKHQWHFDRRYVYTNIGGKNIGLHRFLLNYNGNLTVDHKDRDTLNNRKNNLRVATQQEQNLNRGVQKRNKNNELGVWYRKERSKWCAELNIIYLGKKIRFTKLFRTKDEAVNQRIEWENKYFGDFIIKERKEFNEEISNN